MTKNIFSTAFDTPNAEHTACPFWFWNGDMEHTEIRRQIYLMFEQGIKAFVIHARVGLFVPYLSKAWFDCCGVAIETAAQLGMKIWIYDEDNWPSGYAGGRVLEQAPSFVGQNLGLVRHYLCGGETWHTIPRAGVGEQFVFACRIDRVVRLPPDPLHFQGSKEQHHEWFDLAGHEHHYALESPVVLDANSDWVAPDGYWCIMNLTQQPTNWIAAYSNHPYVDLLSDGATTAFIESTHEQYARRFSAYFGSTILGFFVDEPGLYNNFWDRNVASLSWTHDFAQQFAQRRGYDLRPKLPLLWENLGDATDTLRFDYWQTVSDLLGERFFSKLANWCEAHGMQLTGHLEWEEWMFTMTRHSATPFRALAPFHVPGVDKIDEVVDKLSEKLVASVAHANGRNRVLSETFALIGWKLAPTYMKQIIDQQYARGVNWLSCHGFYYSTEDFRKRECPPSEFFQNPWWSHSQPLWNYVARLSAVLSQGHHVAPVALYYPTEHAWATVTPDAPLPSPPSGLWETWQIPDPEHPTQRTDLSMIQLGLRLLDQQMDFDLVDADLMASAQISETLLCIGSESFRAVVVPSVDVISASALAQMLEFAARGGVVVFSSVLPSRILGDTANDWSKGHSQLALFSQPGFLSWGQGKLGFVPEGIAATIELLRSVCRPDVELELLDDGVSITLEGRPSMFRQARIRYASEGLKYHRRHADGTDAYFLVNESDQPLEGVLRLVGGNSVEEWIPNSGKQLPLTSVARDGRQELSIAFAPRQSRLLVLKNGDIPEVMTSKQLIRTIPLTEWQMTVGTTTRQGSLVSWTNIGCAFYSGIGTYQTTLDLSEELEPNQSVVLDLGMVLETAQATLNGVVLTPLAWSPYQLEITEHLKAGVNLLHIEVANTNTNALERVERPSGLLGPVQVQIYRSP